MNKKIIAIITAIALIASMGVVAMLASCNNNENDGDDNEVELGGDADNGDETGENGNGTGTSTSAKNPGEYTYTTCNETVYVYKSAVNLRTENYDPKGELKIGTQLTRTGISTDADKYWSRVEYNGETLYVASKYLTDINEADVDAGFVACDKTVDLKEGNTLNIRSLPSTQSEIRGDVATNVGRITGIKVIAENTTTGWYKIEYADVKDGNAVKTGYISSTAKYYATAETPATNNNTQEPAGGTGK